MSARTSSSPRRRSPAPALAVPLTLAALLSACGGTTGAATHAAPASTSSASSSVAPPSAAAGAAQVLTGVVGVEDAFVITLVDSSGAPVTHLTAGSYEVEVDDASKIHDFHLTGPGVDKTTTVPEVTRTTWQVDLTPGTYTFHCDPHAKMTGTFTVD